MLGLGADEFINYHEQRFEDAVKDVDAVFDTVGGETLERSYGVVKKGGWLVSIVGEPAQDKLSSTEFTLNASRFTPREQTSSFWLHKSPPVSSNLR